MYKFVFTLKFFGSSCSDPQLENAEKVDMEDTIEEVDKVEVREIVKVDSIVKNTDQGESCKVKESAESPIEVEATEKVKVTDESLPNDSIGATTSREASTAVVYATYSCV